MRLAHVEALAAATAVVLVAATGGWRTAVLALLAAGAVAATRVRYAPIAAVALLAVTAALAVRTDGLGG